ncbi:hypothetical protein P4O66_020373, partial [Electrophorus voltai]
CRNGENMCPYSITLPPLTIQLPKHFRDLDKMARELQSLTLMVNQLREECQECRGRQRPEWSVRTDDGGKAGERIQASRGTVNTRERQHDLHKRVRIVQSTTPNSAGEDTMLISSGTREVNRVIGIPGWNMSQERNMKTSSSGQRAESSGGPQRSNLSHVEMAAESVSESMETKLFHVTKPKNPGGKRELDTITHGVRDDNVETVLSHDTVNHDSDDNRGRASLQVVGKTEETDRRQRAKPFMANSVGSNQDNAKAPFKVETPPSSSGNILLTVKREGSKRKELNYPTTVDMLYTIKPLNKDKEGPVTQFTTPAASATYFMDQDYVEKVETSPGVKVSDTHVHYRFKNSSEDVESKTLTEKISDHDRGDKQSDLDLQSTGKAGGPSDETMLHPNTADSVQKRAIGSIPLVMDRIKDSTVAKGSAPSTESTQIYHKNSKYSFTTSKSIVNNNSYNNGNAYPVAVGRTGDNQRMKDIIAQKTTAEGSSKENKKRPFTGINVEDRDNLETQLLNTCQGQCDQRPTLQPTLSTRRSFETDRDKQQDCSDLKKNMKNGVYSMTPVGSKHASFHVFCDMEASDGGWTLIQRRLDGTISFNRTWDEYKKGFGSLTGEFWLGNDKIHWLTAARAMALRLELEDLDGIKEYAQYDDFYVANESLNYQLTIGEYSGTAGNAMQHSKRFNHNQKYFSTPDRDNDEYPSGNCGAYYSSGWWFDACMAANLNGKYYQTRYKGVRNGIFWGTWHNISNEYYPTNDRQSFKTVRMMIRPRENSVLNV